MPEEQQQAAAPAANDTKTSWSFGDFAKGLGSPLTKNEDGSYNVAGALLTGVGSGLITWVLSRMLGIKSGPSLGISILAALAGTHGVFTKQGGLDFFSNPKGYLKDFMDQKRANGDQPASPAPQPAPQNGATDTTKNPPTNLQLVNPPATKATNNVETPASNNAQQNIPVSTIAPKGNTPVPGTPVPPGAPIPPGYVLWKNTGRLIPEQQARELVRQEAQASRSNFTIAENPLAAFLFGAKPNTAPVLGKTPIGLPPKGSRGALPGVPSPKPALPNNPPPSQIGKTGLIDNFRNILKSGKVPNYSNYLNPAPDYSWQTNPMYY